MAKISANGATKVAERRVSQTPATTTVFVLCSDGRVLSRLVFSDGTSDSYRVAGRIRSERTSEARLAIFERYCDKRAAARVA